MVEQHPSGAASWAEEARAVARAVRRRVLDYTLRNDGGYVSQACSSAELLATLYTRLMKLGPSEGPPVPVPFAGVPGPGNPDAKSGAAYNGPRGPELDRFFFSPVHYALVLYATLIEVGRLAPEGLEQFNQDGGTVELIGAEHSPGHEVTAGSLAQTLSVAGGVALGRRLKGDAGRCWVFMSDGELQEGQTWEAFQALAHHRLDTVRVVIDANGQQCDGEMDGVMIIEPAVDRLVAFGADAVEVDGHDVEAIARAAEAPAQGKPRVVLARTDPCRGIDALQSRPKKLHHVRFASDEERGRFRAELAKLSGEG
ncbi:MAG: transketolase [Deltaproteobacteria bacterium]|nr:transketolase [Deltaproteobacteria bacterium]MBW2531792.1 transketolase [Deltaproteobacteria bacterium]